jgi:nucleotide-binding universal stress UspA family protein
MYNRLLVTLDGSDFARAALDEAVQVADGNSTVILSEVIDSIGQVIARTTPVAFGVDATPDLTAAERVIESQIAGAEAQLKAARGVLRRAGIESIEIRILDGQPGPEIVKLANDEEVEVIVMATHGRSGVRRAVLGSVSDYVVRNTGATVLLVRPAAEVDQPQVKEDVVAAT